MNEILDGIHAAIQQVAQGVQMSSTAPVREADTSGLRRELAATERRMRKVLGRMRSAKAQSVPIPFAMPLQTPEQRAKSAAVMRSALRCRKGRYRSAAQFGMAGNASPVVVSKLAPYLHDLLGDVTKEQSRVISQAIKRGIDRKWADSTVARLLVSKADLDPDRAKVVARTEMSRARSDIALGKKRDSAKVVFVLGDEDACPICRALEGTVRTVRKAQGVIPVHPACGCRWEDAGRGAKVTRNKAPLTWNGRIYPKSVLFDSLLRFSALNQFCATGEGGGVDPSCGSSGEKVGEKPPAKPTPDQFEEWMGKGWTWGNDGWEPPQTPEKVSGNVSQEEHRAAASEMTEKARKLVETSHDWQTSKPWNASEEDVKRGDVAGFKSGGKQHSSTEAAHYEDGVIHLSPAFFAIKDEVSRKHVIYHELGHEIASSMTKDMTAFRLSDAGVFPKKHGMGSSDTPEEFIADAFATLHTDRSWVESRHSASIPPLVARAKAMGMPLPKMVTNSKG